LEEINAWLEKVKSILEFELISLGGYHLSLYNLVIFVFILLLFRLIVKGLEKLIKRQSQRKEWITQGKQHAIFQIGKYVLYVIGFLFAIKSINIDITPLIIGSSALFVGLGFGLQEAFRDFISGLILLFEGDVLIGDVIEFENGMVAVVKQINMRTSKVRTRDGIVIFVPNSQLINNRVINWSNSNILTRFHVGVGVSYGSDLQLVEKILMEVANADKDVSSRAKPFVRFTDFGNSSLDFELHFWSEEVWRIEFIKSRLRFEIDKKFRENGIVIPFPQRDLHVRSSDISFKS